MDQNSVTCSAATYVAHHGHTARPRLYRRTIILSFVPPSVKVTIDLDGFEYMCILHIRKASLREVCMDTMKRANRSAERMVKTSADSYKMVMDHVVAQQERNVRFAQGLLDEVASELWHQAESNRSVVGELVERAEAQRDAYRTLVGEWVDVYTDLLYAPFAYYRQGLRLVENQVDDVAFPISGYDEMNVKEIGERLEGLSAAEIRTVREYEKRNKNRETLIEQFDRKLRAASA